MSPHPRLTGSLERTTQNYPTLRQSIFYLWRSHPTPGKEKEVNPPFNTKVERPLTRPSGDLSGRPGPPVSGKVTRGLRTPPVLKLRVTRKRSYLSPVDLYSTRSRRTRTESLFIVKEREKTQILLKVSSHESGGRTSHRVVGDGGERVGETMRSQGGGVWSPSSLNPLPEPEGGERSDVLQGGTGGGWRNG